MKTISFTFFVTMAIAVSASAGPRLLLDTVVTDTDAHGKDKTLAHFHQLTRSGSQVVLPVGQRRYAVTPTLRKDGTVGLSQTMTHPNYRGSNVTLGPERQAVALGETNDISFGSVTYSTKVTTIK